MFHAADEDTYGHVEEFNQEFATEDAMNTQPDELAAPAADSQEDQGQEADSNATEQVEDAKSEDSAAVAGDNNSSKKISLEDAGITLSLAEEDSNTDEQKDAFDIEREKDDLQVEGGLNDNLGPGELVEFSRDDLDAQPVGDNLDDESTDSDLFEMPEA